MAESYSGRRRIRKKFGTIGEVAEMPNLIEVQKSSYDDFLMVKEPPGGRLEQGLQAVFKSVKDVKEQDVYMGDMPFMTSNGTFIINGTERVIVSQMHRSPGVFFDHDKGKTHSSGKLLFAARIIPYRGSWLDFEFDAKDIIHVRIDRRRKLPITTLLYALGLDSEQILHYFYKTVSYALTDGGWRTPFDPQRYRGAKPAMDLVDAKTKKVVVEAGTKITPRLARKI